MGRVLEFGEAKRNREYADKAREMHIIHTINLAKKSVIADIVEAVGTSGGGLNMFIADDATDTKEIFDDTYYNFLVEIADKLCAKINNAETPEK